MQFTGCVPRQCDWSFSLPTCRVIGRLAANSPPHPSLPPESRFFTRVIRHFCGLFQTTHTAPIHNMQNRIFNNIIYTITFPRLGLCNLKEYRIRKDLFSFKNLPISLKEKAYDVSSSDVLTSNLFIYILYKKKILYIT